MISGRLQNESDACCQMFACNSVTKVNRNGLNKMSCASRYVLLVRRKGYGNCAALSACQQKASLFAVGSKLSLPARAELKKSRCPGALSHGPGGCKGPKCVHMTHCQG